MPRLDLPSFAGRTPSRRHDRARCVVAVGRSGEARKSYAGRVQQTSHRRASAPLRAVLVVLLLAGLGLWQAWQCTDGMAASPVIGMPAMSAMAPAVDSGPDAATGGAPAHDDGMAGGLAGLCITVLASVAAAFLLFTVHDRLVALIRRLAGLAMRPISVPMPGPSLTLMCVSRT